jgi:thiol-disulfide isomerase/thioredoxin
MPLSRLTAMCSAVLMLPLACTGQATPAPAAGASAAAPAAAAPAKPAYLSDPKFVAVFTAAKELEHKRQYDFAIDDYKKANKIAGGACSGCLDKAFALQIGLHNFKDALATADQMAAIAVSPIEKSIAAGDRGRALLAQAGDKPKPGQLDAAHQAFQQAMTEYPKNNAARYHDACVLARMGKDDEASKEFADCAAMEKPGELMAVRARHFAEDPKLSLNQMAPPFQVTTLDGAKFNLDDMQGRVVLIDFWATWCGPCNEELPHLAKIVKEFSAQPLVVISISVDKDEEKWKDFVAKHQMTWVQYRDKDGSISRNFGNQLIPSYYMIGSDGVMVQTNRMGADADVEGRLKKLLKQAHEEPKASGGEVATAGN